MLVNRALRIVLVCSAIAFLFNVTAQTPAFADECGDGLRLDQAGQCVPVLATSPESEVGTTPAQAQTPMGEGVEACTLGSGGFQMGGTVDVPADCVPAQSAVGGLSQPEASADEAVAGACGGADGESDEMGGGAGLAVPCPRP